MIGGTRRIPTPGEIGAGRLPRVVVLIGPPGSGKSTIGRKLARQLGWTFLDTDALVEAEAGMSVSEVFATQGEQVFREMERRAVRAAVLGEPHAPPRVVSLGGGAVMDEASAGILPRNGTVFLDIADAAAIRRVGLADSRPLLSVSPRAQWRRLMAERRPIYERLATLTVRSDQAGASHLAHTIARKLGLESTKPPPAPGQDVSGEGYHGGSPGGMDRAGSTQ